MIHAIIRWSLRNRLLVILGALALIGAGVVLGPQPERRGLSRPDAPADRSHHAEPRRQSRGDGAAGRNSARDRPQRHAGPGDLRSTSIAGLTDIKCQFTLWHRLLGRPPGGSSTGSAPSICPRASSRELSPWSPTGEIVRYVLEGPGYTTNQLKAVQDWVLNRALKQVPGVIDVTGYGGTVKQYQVLLDTRLTAPVRRDDAAGRGGDRPVQRQRRRRPVDARQPVAQRPGHRPAGRGNRPARPGQRRSGRRDRDREARRHPATS